jgi:AraC-like DNA-binding protein
MSNLRQAPDATVAIRTFGITFRRGQAAPPRQIVPPGIADWHQLVYATRGAVTVRTTGPLAGRHAASGGLASFKNPSTRSSHVTGETAWLVPPHCGLVIRAGLQYRVEMSGVVALRMLYFRPRRGAQWLRGFPAPCAVVNVTPLLRELIVRAVRLGALDTAIPEQKRLAAVIADEVRSLTAVPLQLPLPQDPRAVRLAAALRDHPALPLAELLRRAGAGRRTLERVFRAETSMSLGQWLRRERLLEGLHRLAAGDPVRSVALDLAYSSPSAFISMFRRELGQTPRRYLAGRYAGS